MVMIEEAAPMDGVVEEAGSKMDVDAPVVKRTMEDMKNIGNREKLLIPVISRVLQSIVQRNDQLGLDKPVTAFHALKPPAVSLPDYLERVRKYSYCSPCSFVVALIYIDRLISKDPSIVVSSLNAHRLTLTAVLIASKFLDDFYYNNAYWAKVGGVSCTELNTLELELLFKLNFDLHVQTEEYLNYREELVAQGADANDGTFSPDASQPHILAAEREELVDTFCGAW